MCCTPLAENTGCKKIAKNSPSVHHSTTLSGYIFATKACIDNRKKLVKEQYVLHLFSQYGELRPISGWDQFTSLGHPGKFQWVSGLGFITAPTLLNGSQPNFAQCLPISRAGTIYIHFWGLLSLNRILPGAKFTFRPSLAFSYIFSVNAQHSSSRCHFYGIQQRAPPIFGRAAITLGISPHSSCYLCHWLCQTALGLLLSVCLWKDNSKSSERIFIEFGE